MDIQWLYGFIGILERYSAGRRCGLVQPATQRLADKTGCYRIILRNWLLDETGVRLHTGSRRAGEQSLENARHISAQQEAEIGELTTRLESAAAAEENSGCCLTVSSALNTQFENLAARIF